MGSPCQIDLPRQERFGKGSASAANKIEVITALRILAGRNLGYETPDRIPKSFREFDRKDNYDELSEKGETLDQHRPELVKWCKGWHDVDPTPLFHVPDVVGTNFHSERRKYWSNLSYVDLSYADMRSMNLAGFNLIGSRLCGAELAHSNLAKATLEGADLNKCDLWDANLREARLTWVSCRAAELGRANLTDAWLLGAHLNGVDFYQTNLDGAFLIGADLTDVKTMAAVSARNANLWKATLVNAFIGDRDLFQKIRDEEKELSDGTLFDKQLLANLYVEREAAKVHLEGAFLCSADLSRAFFWNVDLDGADLPN